MDRENTFRKSDRTPEAALPGLSGILADPAGYGFTLKKRLQSRFELGRGRTAAVALLGAAAVLLTGFVLMVVLMLSIPDVDDLGRPGLEQATIVYTAGGDELTRYYEENRTWAPIDSIAPVVIDALVATEDRRFYNHWGIDIRRTIAAAFRTLTGETQGGSTITMQMARNAFPNVSDDFMLKRKAKEWLTALRIERSYQKDAILELYLNTVPFNYRAYGIDAAAQTYFSKDATELDTLEAATLVGMLKGTTLYNPVRNPDKSRHRRNVVLRQMVEAGYLSQDDFERLSRQETHVQFSPMTPTNNVAPYFADYVRAWLEDWAAQNGYNLYRDGLRVHTTLDADMQREAEDAVSDQLELLQAVVDVTWSRAEVPMTRASAGAFSSYRENVEPFAYFWEANPDVIPAMIRQSSRYKRLTQEGLSEEEALARLRQNDAFVDSLKSVYSTLQAGFLAMNPENGHIKAWVGGRDYSRYPFDHVAAAKRQPGSTFKPFVYAAALNQGFSPLDSLRDAQLEYVSPETNRRWSPGNFGDETGRMLAVRDGLALSKNTITARLALEVGPDRVADMAHRMGIESELDVVPSLALGTSEVTLLEMVAAYGTIASSGTYHEPVAVTHIDNARGRRLASFSTETRQAVRPEIAYGLLDMMRGVIDYGTGIRMQSKYGARGDLAGKSGTTQRGADGWFMVLHPELVMGSWIGFPSPAISFRTRYWGQGSHNALRIVGNFYQGASLSRDARFEAPPEYVPPKQRRIRTADTSGFELPDFALEEDARRDSLETVEEDARRDTLETLDDSAFAVRDTVPEDTEAASEDAVQPEASSEIERLNRQEREETNLDQYLEQLDDDDDS